MIQRQLTPSQPKPRPNPFPQLCFIMVKLPQQSSLALPHSAVLCGQMLRCSRTKSLQAESYNPTPSEWIRKAAVWARAVSTPNYQIWDVQTPRSLLHWVILPLGVGWMGDASSGGDSLWWEDAGEKGLGQQYAPLIHPWINARRRQNPKAAPAWGCWCGLLLQDTPALTRGRAEKASKHTQRDHQDKCDSQAAMLRFAIFFSPLLSGFNATCKCAVRWMRASETTPLTVKNLSLSGQKSLRALRRAFAWVIANSNHRDIVSCLQQCIHKGKSCVLWNGWAGVC